MVDNPTKEYGPDNVEGIALKKMTEEVKKYFRDEQLVLLGMQPLKSKRSDYTPDFGI